MYLYIVTMHRQILQGVAIKRCILVLRKCGCNIYGSSGGVRRGGGGGRQSSQPFLSSQKKCCSLHCQYSFGVKQQKVHQLLTQERAETKVIETSRLPQSCKDLRLAADYFWTFNLCPTRTQVLPPSNVLAGLELYG